MRVISTLIKALSASALLLIGGACAPLDGPAPVVTTPTSTGSTTSTATANDNGYSGAYRIGAGDTLAVSVWRNEDLSASVPVRPDGKISVPLAGDIDVGNRTPEEVSATITEKLAKYIRDPFVTVIVTNIGENNFRSRVRVTGAVAKPVSLPYRQGMTVLDVVLEAGGANEFANLSKASLYRTKNGERLGIRLDRILKRGDMATNHPLQPGDVVTVPQSLF